MAGALCGVVIEALLTNVISLANDQISAVLAVKDDLQSLAETLEQIQALLDVAHSRSTNRLIENWLKRLEDVAADADDLLDDFAYQVQSKKMLQGNMDTVRSFFSSSNPVWSRNNLASGIKKIKIQMNEISKNAKDLGLRAADIINSPTDPREVRLTYRFVDDSKIVGRGEDVSRIVSLLTCPKNEKYLSVIGIVGMGGQGKTALSKLLMKNEQVKKHFEKAAWTCVSDDFNVDRVLNDMLQSLTKKDSRLTNREVIVEELSKELKGKRFLLVLDDVWNKDNNDSKLEELWENMNDSLREMGGSNGSQIIVTTRDRQVVNVMKGSIYELGVLSRKASQELFEKMAFGDGREANIPQLEKIGERIVARCGGVPLALKAIGGLLSYERNEREWRRIAESDTLDGVHSAIKLSFDHLPSLSLKQCFAYCSVFPKDSVIEKNLTIQQWMAHGWLNPTSGSGLEMEDVGNNYFKILLQRSLLQEAEFDGYGNIVSCKMHDLVHDFALTVSKGCCLTATVGKLSDEIKAVHLSIVPDESNDSNISEKKFSRLRTLHLPHGFSSENFFAHCKCENLRVLTLVDWEMKELPISIAKMKHLRYLDISRTGIRNLPEFISKLYNLQTLRLSLDEINWPKDFVRLVKLRHLDGCYSSPLPGVGQLTFLRTLNYFHVTRDEGCQIKELCSLNHLEGSLTIDGLENVASWDDAKKANLSGKRNIERLQLHWSRNNTEGSSNDESVLEGLKPQSYLKALEINNFKGKSLPSWIPRLHNLIELELEYLENCKQIPSLGHLPLLKILRIGCMRSVKCIGNDFYGCQTSPVRPVVFPSLKELTFDRMPSLEEWSDMVQPSCVSSSSSVELFPCLESLKIKDCSSLIRLPEGLLSAITSLESLIIEGCRNRISVPSLSSFHSLKELEISGCEQFSALPRGIEGCRSLQKLTINCSASVIKSLQHHLTHLRKLSVDLSKDVMEPISNSTDEDDIQGHDDTFSPLEDLTLRGKHEIKSLPDQIQRFTALRALRLSGFGGLETLPEWLGNFHSLESLTLYGCDSLANFPSEEAMRGLTNLKYLSIANCPILKERCERETGAEWHKIKDIARIRINGCMKL